MRFQCSDNLFFRIIIIIFILFLLFIPNIIDHVFLERKIEEEREKQMHDIYIFVVVVRP